MTLPVIGFGKDAGVRIDFATFLERRLLIQAASGAGKSTLMRGFIEELAGTVQQWVVDREGDLVTLREAGDFVLVGRGGDVPADRKTVKVLARRLMELGASAIFDLSELRIPEQREYVKLLFDELTHMPRALWHPLVVWLDEGHMFAPEKESAVSLSAVIDAASLWRKRGYCLGLATQRLSKLDKDVAAELHNKIIGYTDDVDVKRAGDQLGMTTEQRAQLQLLEPGQFYARGPAISRASVLVRAPKPKTVPPPKGQARAVAPPAPEKVRAILGKLADLAAEAEEEARTVEDLRRNVAERDREIRQLKKGGAVQTVEKPVVDQAAIDRACSRERARIRGETGARLHQIESLLTRIADAAREATAARDLVSSVIGAEPLGRQSAEARALPASTVVKREAKAPAVSVRRESDPAAVALPVGERATLIACAQYPDGADRTQISILTQYKRSSRDAYISRLVAKGYVEVRGGVIVATDDGCAALGRDFEPLPTGEALRDHWLGVLPEGERRVLEVLLAAYPEAVARQSIDDETGYKRSSRDAYLSRLGARKLVTTSSAGAQASAILFEEV